MRFSKNERIHTGDIEAQLTCGHSFYENTEKLERNASLDNLLKK